MESKSRLETCTETHIRTFELPGDASHDIDSVSSANSNADGTQTPAVGCVGVCANQHNSWVGVVFQNYLESPKHKVEALGSWYTSTHTAHKPGTHQVRDKNCIIIATRARMRRAR